MCDRISRKEAKDVLTLCIKTILRIDSGIAFDGIDSDRLRNAIQRTMFKFMQHYKYICEICDDHVTKIIDVDGKDVCEDCFNQTYHKCKKCKENKHEDKLNAEELCENCDEDTSTFTGAV